MPHQCTTCERTFPDGSKAMLGGCPDCGGNKFQFRPPGSDSTADDDILEAPSEPLEEESAAPPSGEDVAQASARSSVVSPDELPPVDDREAVLQEIAQDAKPSDAERGREKPDLETLRRELNDQFESIKIVAPGEYELNLMELYDREEYIIALEEDGRYVIDVPTGFGDREDDADD
ncbi:MAG: Zn-ribbon containing protein [Halobacteriales archaeon]|nr:Zn-ribbon containing protein [Halobacteriales archaeon]